MELFNQFSFIWISLIILLIGAGVMRLFRLKWRVILPVIVIATLAFTGAWLALRQSVSDVNNADAAVALIGSGKPTFVEFFSQY
jgi:hypothetical protein